MPVTIIYNKANQQELEVSGLVINIYDETEKGLLRLAKYKQALSINHKVDESNLALIQFENDSAEGQRLRNGDEYVIVWSDAAPDGELTGIDFAIEDAKKKFTVEVSDDNILVGETIDLTVRLFDSDGVTPKTNINSIVRLSVQLPRGASKIRMQFVNGVATKTVALNEPGVFTLGAKRNDNYVLKGDMPIVEVDL